MRNSRFFLLVLIAFFLGTSANAQRRAFPLVTWYTPRNQLQPGQQDVPLATIWALSGVDSTNARVVTDIKKTMGWRCQSLNPCIEPQGYQRNKYVFNCLTKDFYVDNSATFNLGNSVAQYNFVAWEVFAIACPRWENQVQQLRQNGQMYPRGFEDRD
jgi:hypothetical protein